jgi:hypothetical protein
MMRKLLRHSPPINIPDLSCGGLSPSRLRPAAHRNRWTVRDDYDDA